MEPVGRIVSRVVDLKTGELSFPAVSFAEIEKVFMQPGTYPRIS